MEDGDPADRLIFYHNTNIDTRASHSSSNSTQGGSLTNSAEPARQICWVICDSCYQTGDFDMEEFPFRSDVLSNQSKLESKSKALSYRLNLQHLAAKSHISHDFLNSYQIVRFFF